MPDAVEGHRSGAERDRLRERDRAAAGEMDRAARGDRPFATPRTCTWSVSCRSPRRPWRRACEARPPPPVPPATPSARRPSRPPMAGLATDWRGVLFEGACSLLSVPHYRATGVGARGRQAPRAPARWGHAGCRYLRRLGSRHTASCSPAISPTPLCDHLADKEPPPCCTAYAFRRRPVQGRHRGLPSSAPCPTNLYDRRAGWLPRQH